MSNESRASMVRSAAALIGSRGVNATSFTDVLADSDAPRGSIYHHFPAGKRQLTEDAIRLTSEQILDYLRAAPTDSAESVLRHFVALWRGSAGCPSPAFPSTRSPARPSWSSSARRSAPGRTCSPRNSSRPAFPPRGRRRSP